MDTKPLTSTQKKTILRLLNAYGSAAIMGQSGRVGMKRTLRYFDGAYGLVIEAYQGPDYFLKCRGLIERVESNAQGVWYRLTEDGARRAAKLTK